MMDERLGESHRCRREKKASASAGTNRHPDHTREKDAPHMPCRWPLVSGLLGLAHDVQQRHARDEPGDPSREELEEKAVHFLRPAFARRLFVPHSPHKRTDKAKSEKREVAHTSQIDVSIKPTYIARGEAYPTNKKNSDGNMRRPQAMDEKFAMSLAALENPAVSVCRSYFRDPGKCPHLLALHTCIIRSIILSLMYSLLLSSISETFVRRSNPELDKACCVALPGRAHSRSY